MDGIFPGKDATAASGVHIQMGDTQHLATLHLFNQCLLGAFQSLGVRVSQIDQVAGMGKEGVGEKAQGRTAFPEQGDLLVG